MTQHLHYRPEVDGLRAIAVIAVLLFHFDPRLAPGGFTGVDIFFVISGFLITSIIVKSHARGSFSFRNFYLRRIRRIAPPYLTVVLATLVAGCVLMQPEDLAHLGRSAFWSVLASPNIFFWLNLDTSYFATDSRQLPLLHLWSLGVEEQFYLLWPMLLVACLRFLPGRLLWACMAVAIIGSFAYAHHASAVDPAFSYYMLPTRAGELGIGAALALVPGAREPRKDGGSLHEIVALAGLGLMAWSIFALDSTSRFPGWNALPACLGAALVILADSRRQCLSLAPLRWRPVVAIGLISYSLYLWHWPILAFARYLAVQLDARTIAVLLVLIFAAAISSYRFIERPARSFRTSDLKLALQLFFAPAAILLALSTLVITQAGHISQLAGKPGLKQAERRLLASTAPAYEFPYNCQLEQFDPAVLERPQCLHGRIASEGADVLLWGDSHAAHYIGILASIVETNGLGMRNASLSTCPPVWSERTDYGMRAYQPACTQFRALIEAGAAPYPVIAIGAQWSIHARHDNFWRDFETTLDALLADGKRIVLLAEVPAFPGYDRHCEVRNLRHEFVDCIASMKRRDSGTIPANAHLQSIADGRAGVEVFDISDMVCRESVCSPHIDGRPVYFDPSHLSMEGSWELGRRLTGSGIGIPVTLNRRLAEPAAVRK